MWRYVGLVSSGVLLLSCAAHEPEDEQGSDRLKGLYTYGHEVSSFQPCNSSAGYWAVLPEAEASRLNAMSLEKAERVGQPYQPVYVELTGALSSSANEDGFAADYDAILEVSKVQKVSSTIPESCVTSEDNAASSGWQNTQAEITNVQPLGDGSFAYSITYTPSTGPDGKAAEPISQHAFGVSRAPVLGQKVEIRYRAEEPVIYELLNELQWSEEG
ncbi:MAG: hypothetical protein CSB44_02675 [Gammaproteobacteria bacterium]|nr:MAG: hypothetical protein CSB44_02675 [Gammaproteobacteria bacterium]